MVGLLRSGRLGDDRRLAFERRLRTAGGAGGALDDLPVRQQLAQEEIVLFLGRQIEENAALRRSMPSLSRPASLLSMVMFPFSFPGSLLGKTIEISFTVAHDGSVADVKFTPEVTDAPFRALMMEAAVKYRFRPALDRYGQPGPSTYRITYRFGREAQRR
jgi:hypothetical protein